MKFPKAYRLVVVVFLVAITTSRVYGGPLLDQAIQLSNRLIIGHSQNNNSAEYFALFPSDFEIFIDLFGYKEGNVKSSIGMTTTVYGPLYASAFEHIKFFFSTSDAVGLDEFTDKSISLVTGGYWQSDGASFLQVEMLGHIRQYHALYVDKLSQLSPVDFQALVKFLNDTGPDGVDLQLEWIIEPVCELNAALCNNIKQ